MSGSISNPVTSLVPITQKPNLSIEAVNGDAVLYIVNDNKDFHIRISTIVDFVSKYINATSLRVNLVNNTPDSEKPISTLMREALDGKADKSEIASIQAIEELHQLLGQKVPYIDYEVVVNELLQRIVLLEQNTQGSIEDLIHQTIEPISQSLEEKTTQITELENQLILANQQITSLQQSNAQLTQDVEALKLSDASALLLRIVALEEIASKAVIEG